MAYSDFHDELLDLICSVTGAVRTGGAEKATLFTSVETAHLSIVQYMAEGMQGGKGRPAPPYYAVQVGDLIPDDRFGGLFYSLAPVTFAVLDGLGNAATNPNQKTLHAQAEAVRTAIDDPLALFETFQGIERGRVDSSASNPVFRALAVESKVSIVAATVAWTPGLQVFPDAEPD